MKPPSRLRDHLFVLAWVVLAVIAKYSISFSNGTESPAPKIDPGLATAPVPTASAENE